MTTTRIRWSAAARWTGMSLALVASAGAIAAAAVVPVSPVPVAQPPSVSAQPEAAASVLVCAGPLIAVGRDASDASALTQAATSGVTWGVAEGGAEPERTDLTPTDVSDGDGPASYNAAPVDRVRTDMGAATYARVSSDDLAGFSAAACTPPEWESWLVAGSATTGASDLVLLSNPSDVAASVSLTLYGGNGETIPGPGADIVVPAGAQRVIPLASLAIGESSPVVRVTATGAPVQASVQASIVRTLLPGGVDQVGVSAAPRETQVIPAVTVTQDAGEDGASDVGTVLRVLAPSEDAEVTITVTEVETGDPNAGDPVLERQVSLTAGLPVEVELGGLSEGLYSVRLDGSAPVIGGVWAADGFGEGSDFAWYSSAEVLSVPSMVAVVRGPGPVLTMVNSADSEAEVTVAGDSGADEPRTYLLPAGGAVQVDVEGGQVYRIATDAEAVSASVSFRGDGELGGYPVVPADAAAEPVVVVPQ